MICIALDATYTNTNTYTYTITITYINKEVGDFGLFAPSNSHIFVKN